MLSLEMFSEVYNTGSSASNLKNIFEISSLFFDFTSFCKPYTVKLYLKPATIQ